MMVLVSYDVSVISKGGAGRLRRIAKKCQDYGQRVQNSVFECVVDPAQWIILKSSLEKLIDKESDSLRYYYLGSNYKNKVEHVGAKPSRDLDSAIII